MWQVQFTLVSAAGTTAVPHAQTQVSTGAAVKQAAALTRLYHQLLLGYEMDVRPAVNYTMPVNVTFGLALIQIMELDERNQILTANAWINQQWVDHNLQWAPPSYGNITVMHVDAVRLWKPDIVLYNNADSDYPGNVMSTQIIVQHDGTVMWLSAAIFQSSCTIDVRYYPFDEQVCTLKFASWAYDGTKIDLLVESAEGDLSRYIKSTEWALVSVRLKRNNNYFSCCPEPFPDLGISQCLGVSQVVTIRLRRRSMFYIFYLILPCCMFTAVALLGFLMPADSGEKVTMGITTMLSMMIFLMIVAENTPPTAESLPLLGMYYGMTICLVSLATAVTIFTLNLHYCSKGGQPVPRCMQLVFFHLVPIPDPVKSPVNCQMAWDCPLVPSVLRFIDLDSALVQRLHDCSSGKRPFRSFYLSDSSVCPEPADSGGSRQVQLSCGQHSVVYNDTQLLRRKHTDGGPSIDFISQLAQRIRSAIRNNEERVEAGERREAIRAEWRHVALVVDRFLLATFLATAAVVTAGTMCQRHVADWADAWSHS